MIKLDEKPIDINEVLQTPSVFYQTLPSPEIKVGRPVFDGKNENEVVAKLQYAFSIGAKPKEACCYADISTDSFYRYCRKYPEFRDKIAVLQSTITMLARINLYNFIVKGNWKATKFVLERRRPEEYGRNTSTKYRLARYVKYTEYLEERLILNDIEFKSISHFDEDNH